jgi:hypothetical protein
MRHTWTPLCLSQVILVGGQLFPAAYYGLYTLQPGLSDPALGMVYEKLHDPGLAVAARPVSAAIFPSAR